MINIDEIMEKWARWRLYRARDELGYGECMTGKLLDGMPKVKCTCCVRGMQLISIRGVVTKLPCSACHGTEWIVPPHKGVKVNPKLIRGTGGRFDDSTSQRVDRLYCSLRALHQSVVAEEYWHNGTKAIKRDRIGVGRNIYDRCLREALGDIEAGLKSGPGRDRV